MVVMIEQPEIPEIDVLEAHRRVTNGAFFLDVREENEYAESHIAGAILLPLSAFMERYEALLPSDRQIVIHCRSGRRSADATAFLIQHGYDAVNVTGGILAWAEAELLVASG